MRLGRRSPRNLLLRCSLRSLLLPWLRLWLLLSLPEVLFCLTWDRLRPWRFIHSGCRHNRLRLIHPRLWSRRGPHIVVNLRNRGRRSVVPGLRRAWRCGRCSIYSRLRGACRRGNRPIRSPIRARRIAIDRRLAGPVHARRQLWPRLNRRQSPCRSLYHAGRSRRRGRGLFRLDAGVQPGELIVWPEGRRPPAENGRRRS